MNLFLFQAVVRVPIIGHQDRISPINDLGVFVSRIASLFLMIAALATFLYLILGGIKWITASGDKGKLEEARTTITQALIGLAITAAAWAIFLLANHFFGLNVVSSAVPPPQNGPILDQPPAQIVGHSACGCGGGMGCAVIGQIGPIGTGGDCYECTQQGWSFTSQACGPITCAACP